MDGVLAKRGHCGNVHLPCCTWCFPRLVCVGELLPGSVAVQFGGSTASLCSSCEVADLGLIVAFLCFFLFVFVSHSHTE